MLETLTPHRAAVLLLLAKRRVLGDLPGHEFHGNQWTKEKDSTIKVTPHNSGRIEASVDHHASIGGKSYVKGSSRVEAKVEKDGTVVLMRMHTDQENRGRGVATALINRVREEAGFHQVTTSGVFSTDGKAVLESFVRKGEAEKTDNGNYVFKQRRTRAAGFNLDEARDERGRWIGEGGFISYNKKAGSKLESLRAAAARDNTPIHTAADQHLSMVTTAVLAALRLGQKALGDPPDAARAAAAVKRALLRVLPVALSKVLKAGGEVGVAGIKRLKTAGDLPGHEFHGNQWTAGVGGGEVDKTTLEKTFLKAGKTVDGLTVREGVPNESSIASSLDEYESLSGIREVKMSDMDPDYKVKPYSVSESDRLDKLEQAIRSNKKISPLIVVVDKEKHPYILEGGHRYDALRRIGVKSFPAKVVIDTGSVKLRGAEFRTAKGPTNKPLRMRFDATNPRAAKWAKEHAAELAEGISETTEQLVKDAIARAFEEGLGLRESYDLIRDAVGDEARASVIARTETMTAANEGNREGWRQAVDAGLLTGDERRVWIATSDACPLCEELDAKETDLDGSYPGDGEDGPPLHPNCRCTEGIV